MFSLGVEHLRASEASLSGRGKDINQPTEYCAVGERVVSTSMPLSLYSPEPLAVSLLLFYLSTSLTTTTNLQTDT